MQEETEFVSLAQHPQPVFGYRKPFTHPPRGMRFPFQRRVERVHKKEKFPKENEALSAPLERKDPDGTSWLPIGLSSVKFEIPSGFWRRDRVCYLVGGFDTRSPLLRYAGCAHRNTRCLPLPPVHVQATRWLVPTPRAPVCGFSF
jgi:hypothetical protein